MGEELKIGSVLYPKQQEFLRAILQHDRTFYGGAVGGGKSWGLMVIAGILMDLYPGVVIRAIRETLKAANQNLTTKFKKIYPERTKSRKTLYTHNKTENIIYWHNGSQLVIDYCSNLTDAMSKHGLEQDILMVDEAVEHFEDELKYLVSRTRTSIQELGGAKVIFTGNPKGPGLNYIRKEYIESTEFGQYTARKITYSRDKDRKYETTYAFVQAFLKDNFELMKSGYEREVLELSEALQKALLEGDWYVSLGQHLSNYTEKYHMYKRGEIHIEPHWKKHISMDWGFNDFCSLHWYATDEDGVQYVYREYYENQRHIEDVAHAMVELSEDEEIEYLITPFDLFRKQPTAIRDESGVVIGETPADVLTSILPFSLLRADSSKGSRKRGWRACHRMLYLDKNEDNVQCIPRIRISEDCPNLINQIKTIESNPLDIEEILPHQEDHALDDFRYNCDTTFSDDRSYKPKEKIKENTPAWTKQEIEKRNNRDNDDDSEAYY